VIVSALNQLPNPQQPDEGCDGNLLYVALTRAYVVEELGLDAGVHYQTPDLDRALKDACPGGIDVDYDNIGGPVLGRSYDGSTAALASRWWA
jgi:hypothetical protein